MQQLDFLQTLEQPQANCPVCGKSFEKSKIRSRHIYCSRKCKLKQQSVRRQEKLKNQKILPVCFTCKKSYRRTGSKQKFCSKECYIPYKLEYAKQRAKIYRFQNKEKIKETQKKYRIKNKDILKEKNTKYRIKNKDILKEKQKLYNNKNRKKRLQSYKNYHDKNKEKRRLYLIFIKDRTNKRAKEKRRTNIQYRLRTYISSRIKNALKRQTSIKSKKTLELLGCSLEEAKIHLQSQFKEGMTWENHGKYGWHIDHIIPCATFDLTDPEQQKKCFHYTNLQPLWWNENLSKGAKIIG